MHRRINTPMTSVIMPASEVETYLANGWRLTDEPDCSGARMLAPTGSVNRVTAEKQKKTGRDCPIGHREPVKKRLGNEGTNRARPWAQAN